MRTEAERARHRDYMRLYREKGREKINKRRRELYREDPEKHNERCRQWHASNRASVSERRGRRDMEVVREQQREWWRSLAGTRRILSRRTGLRAADIPAPMAEAKLKVLRVQRLLKETEQ